MPDTKRKQVTDAIAAVLAGIAGVSVFHGLDRDPRKADAPGLVWMAGVPSPLSVTGPGAEETGEDGYDMEVEISGIVTAATVAGLDDAASDLYGKVKAALDAADATQFSGAIERCRDVTPPSPVIVLADEASELVAVFPLVFSLRFQTAERTPYV